jgi:serralysin
VAKEYLFMATVSDIMTTPLSGLNYIDALLDSGPDWNYLTTASRAPVYTISYTFSVGSGTEDAASAAQSFTGAQQAFSVSQQAATRTALAYISQLTGIQFVETNVGTDAQIHLSDANLLQSNVTGLCSWHSSYSYSGTQVATYDADAYVYLDNVEWNAQNSNLTPGGAGYETLLHELGHALGLKHPFDTTNDNSAVLPAAQDNTTNTLMSYTHTSGASYSTFRPDDIAALEWLYGGDGLRGALGVNSTNNARFLVGSSGADTLTGTSGDDKFQGNGGNDMIDGGAGTDTAVFNGAYTNYSFKTLANGDLQVTSLNNTDGSDTLHSVELLQFADGNVARADVAVDTTPPAVPQMLVVLNPNGYATGNQPLVSGGGEAGALIKIYTANNTLVGQTQVDATGAWSLKLDKFADGLGYQVYATATDAAGNVSGHTALSTFNIDFTVPVAPTLTAAYTPGSNLATFSGTGEAGTTVDVYHHIDANNVIDIASTTVGADGRWQLTTSPLLSGAYSLNAVSSDKADNSTASKGQNLSFTVSSADNYSGTAADDTLTARPNGNAIDGGAGFDTLVYTGARANYAIAQETWGVGVTDKVGTGGHDALFNIERLQFDDGMVALDVDTGTAGEAYRVYTAVLGRAPDLGGLGFWIAQMDNHVSLHDVAQGFLSSKEFADTYGANPTNQEYVSKLYENVLHRAADDTGISFWLNNLNNGSASRADVLIGFSDSVENKADVIGVTQNGIDYIPYHIA